MNRPLYPSSHKALILAFSFFLLASCRGQAVPVPTQPGGSHPSISARPTLTAPPATVTPAATLPPTATPLPEITTPIVWYVRGPVPADLPQVDDRLNQLLAERGFHARVEIRPVEWSAYRQRLAEIQSAGETWDLVSLAASDYQDWQKKGFLLSLSAYANPRTGQVENALAAYAPELWNGLPAAVWQGMLRSGGIYAVPNQGVWAGARGISIRADVVSALNLQPDLDRVRDFAGLTPLLAKIQAALEDGTLQAGGVADAGALRRAAGQADLLEPDIAGYDGLWGPFVTRFDDPQAQAVNWYQTAEFLQLAALRQEWQQAGYLPDEPLTPEQAAEGYRAGQYVVEVGHLVWPGSALEQENRFGYEWIEKPLAQPFLSTPAVFSTLTGINARIANDPERVRRVLLFLQWLQTDAEVVNLLNARGAGGGASAWQQTARENAQAPASVVLGFVFDPRPVAAQAAAIRGLTLELLDPLSSGKAKNVAKTISAMQKALDEVGLGDVQSELERQLTEWKTAH